MDIEKSEKLPREHRYFNISTIWIFYFRGMIRLLYWLRIPHELVTSLSILAGILSALLFYRGFLISAALALHVKDVLDACDGALARLTGRGSLLGRYLDSLGDFVCLTLVMAAIGARAAQVESAAYLGWMAAAILSTFLQCSFFNYYQLAYVEQWGKGRLISQRDEAHRPDLAQHANAGRWKIPLRLMRICYACVYGWQDRLVAQVDRWLYRRSGADSEPAWYGNKTFMTLVSPLCFGTHIVVMIVCALLGKPQYALVVIATVMNVYLVALLGGRRAVVGG